ncbi:MAG: hypothetical protein PHC50_04395 [Candidatus Cloacimonetes bacterium]|nr:hypothetical protein [Candidatus Cloacimonadota bacterium]
MNMKVIVLALLLMVLVAILPAQTLAPDRNGIPIQAGRSFSTLTVVCSADTLWNKVVVPPGTYSAFVVASAALKVAADSVYVNPAADISLPTAGVDLPVISKPVFWVRRSAAATAANAYILFKRM